MENSTSKIILSFLAGAAAGTALGILLAPDRGEETRQKIKESIDDVSEKAKVAYQNTQIKCNPLKMRSKKYCNVKILHYLLRRSEKTAFFYTFVFRSIGLKLKDSVKLYY